MVTQAARPQILTAADGVSLSVRWIEATGPSLGVLVVLHAMMVDGRTLDRPRGAGLASACAVRGWTVMVCDFRGHGASGTLASKGGSWTYDDLVYRDVPAFIAAARRATNGPVVVLGHSLGGHVALATAASGAAMPDALVAMAANVWMPSLEPSAWARRAKRGAVAALLGITRAVGRFPAQRLGIGTVDEAKPYLDDLARFMRADRWSSADGRHDWLAQCATLKLPVLSVLGGGDTLLARPAGAANWVRCVPGAEVWLVGGGAYGVVGQPGHMDLVTHASCAPVWEHLCHWLAEHVVDLQQV